MALTSGTRLGPYEIDVQLGAGGMGEVYRARDTRLGRLVAIKVLPVSLLAFADSMTRFEREARVVAGLSHPNILAIHDIGRHDGAMYMVLELLEGESLRGELERGPLAPVKALDYGQQMLQGLAAAHAKGVVHRDLKPENLFVTRDGRVKILDFGIASVAADAEAGAPTRAHTMPGAVLGTAGYMSPEQVRGRPADARSDLFAFGVVLFEMLTGRRAFSGESPVETMSAILNDDPIEKAGDTLNLHPLLERTLRHCLDKNPEQRFQSALDVAYLLDGVRGSTRTTSQVLPVLEQVESDPRKRGRRRGLAWLGVIVLTAGVTAGVGELVRRPAPSGLVTERPLTYSGRDVSPAASPDGRSLAFASDRDGRRRIWLKQLAGGNEVALTSGEDDFPRFSPDGSMILFSRTEEGRTSLYRVPMLGGEARRVVPDALDGDWSPDGQQIVFVRQAPDDGTIVSHVLLVGVDGSGERRIAELRGQALRWPRWSPDGRTIALVESGRAGPSEWVFLLPVDGGEPRTITSRDAGRPFAATWSGDGGEILSSIAYRGGGVKFVVQPVDGGAARDLLWAPNASGPVDILGPGRLVYESLVARENLRELTIADRGQPTRDRWLTRGNSADRQPAYSPDGEWVVFTSNRAGNLDIWGLGRDTGVVRRLTEHEASDWDPFVTADGRHLLWSSGRSGNLEIWIAEADGSSPRQLTRDGVDAQNPVATPDGRWVLYATGNPAHSGLWKIRLDGTDATRLVSGTIAFPEISPDGRHVLYLAAEPGGAESIRVARVDDGGVEDFEITIEARKPGTIRLGRPRWMPDGRSIAFVGQDESGVHGIFVQDFVLGRDTTASRRPLGGFDPEVETESFGIAPDGSHLVIAAWQRAFAIMDAEGIAAITPPTRMRQ